MAEEENLTLVTGESRQVTLRSRGASGLQLRCEIADSGIVAVDRKETDAGDRKAAQTTDVGGALPAVFEIRALRAGKTEITFYETRPWEPNFQRIVQRKITITVGQPK